jgi:hypothetical protein
VVQAPPRTGPRRELKIQLDGDAARALRAFCVERLAPDPHVADPGDPSYRVESVYLDTPALDALGSDDFPKYRVRRYDGVDTSLHFEEKFSHSPEVWKRRVPCTADEVDRVLLPADDGPGDLAWFRDRARLLGLRPRLAVAYRRFAFHAPGGLRVTFDDRIRVAPVDVARGFLAVGAGRPIEADSVLELKYAGDPPPVAREILERAGEPAPFSKYRRGMRLLVGS